MCNIKTLSLTTTKCTEKAAAGHITNSHELPDSASLINIIGEKWVEMTEIADLEETAVKFLPLLDLLTEPVFLQF